MTPRSRFLDWLISILGRRDEMIIRGTMLLFVLVFLVCGLLLVPGAKGEWYSCTDELEIEDLTGDTSAIGNPQEPRPFNSDPPPGFLQFDETEYYTYRKPMHGREMRVAFNRELTEVGEQIRGNFANYAFNIWNHYWNIFQGYPFPDYTILFRNGPVTWEGEHGAGYEVPPDIVPNCEYFSAAAHGIFHSWLSGGNGGINPADRKRDLWFIEGFSSYFDLRAYFLYRKNVEPVDDFIDDYNVIMGWSVKYYLTNIKGTEDDIPTIEMGYKWDKTEKAGYFYVKGRLIAYLLDKRMTEDGSGLDQLMRFMFQNFDHGLKFYTTEDILNAVNVITGQDYTQFFDDYIYGNAPLPLDESTRFDFFRPIPSCGDVNLDSEITPADALCVFQEYLGIPSCIQGDPVKLAQADVTLDGEVTPADALCIFQRYLDIPSCMDDRPECPWD